MNKFDYKNMTPFKWFVLENFPFIENDFDAINNYHLFSKVVEYLNKTIDNVNVLGNLVEQFSDYFDNLDVQDEINNKLDEMATDGTLENIINQEIFGNIQTELQNLNTKITNETNNLKRNALYIGNSYTGGVGSTTGSNGIFALTKDLFNNAYMKGGSGTGFLPYTNHETDTFINLLQNAINDNNIPNENITDIIIIGAWGESRAYRELDYINFKGQIVSAINNFYNLAKQNFPKVSKISYYWAESRENKTYNLGDYPSYFSDSFNIHNLLKYICPKCGIEYLGWGGFNILLNSQYFSNDHYHPNDAGYKVLSSYFKSSYSSGVIDYRNITINANNRSAPITPNTQINYIAIIEPDKWTLQFVDCNLKSGDTPSHLEIIKFIDFINENYQLPIPFERRNYTLGAYRQATSLTSTNYDSTKDIIGKIIISKDLTNEGNTFLGFQGFGPSFNIPNNVNNALIFTNNIICPLDDPSFNVN